MEFQIMGMVLWKVRFGVAKGEVIFLRNFEKISIEKLGDLGILGFLSERLKVGFFGLLVMCHYKVKSLRYLGFGLLFLGGGRGRGRFFGFGLI